MSVEEKGTSRLPEVAIGEEEEESSISRAWRILRGGERGGKEGS